MDLFSKNHLQSTTQHYLEINDITNDLVILNDGAVAMVLIVGTLNFGLLSEEEQDAIIYSYAGLLNSLSFNVQILVRSQKKDVSSYLRYIQDIEQQAISPMRKTQIRKYKEFVAGLVKDRNVLDKKFYIVIPYGGAAVGANSPIAKIKKDPAPQLDKPYILEKARNDLEPKRDHLIGQFGRIGLGARQLATQELIQLMHGIYNPNTSDGQRMSDTDSYTSATVMAENWQLYQPEQSEQPQQQGQPQDQAQPQPQEQQQQQPAAEVPTTPDPLVVEEQPQLEPQIETPPQIQPDPQPQPQPIPESPTPADPPAQQPSAVAPETTTTYIRPPNPFTQQPPPPPPSTPQQQTETQPSQPQQL